MSDDIVKRLRSGNTGHQTWLGLCEDAADRIEALTAERDHAIARAGRAESAVQKLRGVLSSSRDCIKSASSQLTKKHAKRLEGKIWGWWYLEQIDTAREATK